MGMSENIKKSPRSVSRRFWVDLDIDRRESKKFKSGSIELKKRVWHKLCNS